jgi:hypothetical protein
MNSSLANLGNTDQVLIKGFIAKQDHSYQENYILNNNNSFKKLITIV